ncbi:hypothetical protein HK107_14905 [Parvularcula sp. ZS-1/3]|uniref:DUF4398 domain-containing protein n=1 Tax=Parvularcula mediterranea TaxID=2732508 RepID=A0A7Y3W6D5_9PROT|nr:hypothetical protein [Parvularcula mediterranea]NNU17619.1 hypothetical protein [Parvularcula mediterranea]
MTKVSKAALAAILLGSLSLTACATGQKDFAEEVTDVAKDWRKGEKKVAEGEEMIREAKAEIRKGEKQISEGEAAAKKATVKVANAQERYDFAMTMFGTSATADEAVKEAKEIKSLEKALKEAQEDLTLAKLKQRKGRDNIADGNKKLAKGEKMVADGRREMEQVQKTYRQIAASAR